MSAPTERQQIARLVRSVHDNMRNRVDPSTITLAAVADQMFQIHGLELTEAEIAECLNQTETNPDRGGPGRSVFGKHAQGRSASSAVAHDCSLMAAEASQTARMEKTALAHGQAAAMHHDAAREHRKAAKYHDNAELYHAKKAAGDDDAMEPEDN